MTPSRKLIRFVTDKYREHLAEIENAAGAPEPLPEHKLAVEALLKARRAAEDAEDGDDTEPIEPIGPNSHKF